MSGRRTHLVVLVLAAVAVITLAACDEPVTSSRADPSFGSNGTRTLTATGWVAAQPLADGGVVTLTSVLQRWTATGALAPGWTSPTVSGRLIGAFPDGTILVMPASTPNVIARYGPTGARLTDLGTVRRPDSLHWVSLDGDRMVVSAPCEAAGSCDVTTVDTYAPDGSVTHVDVPFAGLPGLPEQPCPRGAAGLARRASDGSILVSTSWWCSAPAGRPTTVVRRIVGGAIDADYGGGAGFAVLRDHPTDVAISRTGQVAIQSNAIVHRLTPTGLPDQRFGTVNLGATIGASGPDPRFRVVPNGNGYSISSHSGQAPCSDAEGRVTHLGADGMRVGPQATFAADTLLDLSRYPDGSLLVSTGVSSPSHNGPNGCSAPRATLRKLVP